MAAALHVGLDLILGAVFGFVGGLFGIGGGIVAIPVLGVFFGYSEQAAQGTALVMIVPNVLVGLWNYYRKVGLDLRMALALALAAVPVTYVGAHYATALPSGPLRIAFAVFILTIATYMGWRTFGPSAHTRAASLPWPYAAIVGALGGALSGLFSVGGATFAVPAMSSFFGLTQAAAQGMGLALVAPGTVVSTITYALAHDVNWTTGIALAIGGVATVPRGVDLARRLPERALRSLFIAFLIVSAIGLFARA